MEITIGLLTLLACSRADWNRGRDALVPDPFVTLSFLITHARRRGSLRLVDAQHVLPLICQAAGRLC